MRFETLDSVWPRTRGPPFPMTPRRMGTEWLPAGRAALRAAAHRAAEGDARRADRGHVDLDERGPRAGEGVAGCRG